MIRDRWNNVTDTLIQNLTPLFEEKLDKSLFREFRLPGDEPMAWGWAFSFLWDEGYDEGQGFHTENTDTPYKWPQTGTIDLGKTYLFSRMRFWNRESTGYYEERHANKIDIWGSNSPASDGSWESWTLLMTTHVEKPSGSPAGTVTSEDLAFAKAGFEFIFPSGISPFRYIRLGFHPPFTNVGQVHCMEITFWGAEAK